MKFILGRKFEMTQRYRGNDVVPVTLVKVDPCVVTQLKTKDKDGYVAIQVGAGSSRSLTKPERGQRRGLGDLSVLREFRVESTDGVSVGATCDLTSFASGDIVDVTGVSKGKGFQGVVKRHHFGGGPATHGHKDNLRMPGSIGAGGVQHVIKGLKMAGRMGGDRVTVKNLEIVEVLADENMIAIKGAVPGARGAQLMIVGPGEMKYAQSQASAPATEAEAPVEAAEPEAKNEEATEKAEA